MDLSLDGRATPGGAGLLARVRRRELWAPTGPIAIGLTVLGIIWLGWLFLAVGGNGFDSYAYWRLPHGPTLYSGTETANGLGVFRYSPAFADLVSPLGALDWDAFRAVWIFITVGALAATTGRWTVALIGLPFVAYEIYIGNVHALLGLALVLGLRWPAAWSFLLLTKLTPGVALLWFAARAEWRKLAVALGATALIVAVSIAIGGTGRWVDWLASMQSTSGSVDSRFFLLRLAAAAAITVWGARTDRPWVLPIAVTLSLATIWPHSLVILLAILPLARRQRPGAEPSIVARLHEWHAGRFRRTPDPVVVGRAA
jgi:hypothetical protein